MMSRPHRASSIRHDERRLIQYLQQFCIMRSPHDHFSIGGSDEHSSPFVHIILDLCHSLCHGHRIYLDAQDIYFLCQISSS